MQDNNRIAKDTLLTVYKKGGLLDQAKKAKAAGSLADFFKQLLAQLGPLIGPIIISLLSGLLHL